MPWHVTKTSQCSASEPYGVIKDATGRVVKGGCHATKAEADAHMAALYANEPKAAVRAAEMPDLVTLAGVDIIATGTWRLASGPATITADDLANALDAATCPSVGSPIIKLGHVDPRFDGEPAVGRVESMALNASGTKITADLAGLPGWLGEVMPSAYPNRSMEGARNFVCQQGHTHPFVITGLALLGVTPPGIGVLNSLDDVAALYGVAAASEPEGSGEKWSLVMSEPVTAGGPTIDELRRAYMASAGYQYWITELTLDPLELIVSSDDDQLYRVPVTVGKDGGFTFGDPAPVAISYVDVSQKVAAAAHWSSRDEAEAGLEEVRAAWDAAAQVRNLGDSPSASQLKALFAIPGDNKSDSKLPHHTVSSDGKVGAADPAGVSAAIAALNGSRGGLKGISDSQRQSAYSHLAAHARQAGNEPPPLKGAAPAPGHAAYSGEHSHPHSAMGSQGGDATHEHSHSHSGDAVHDHVHAAGGSGGKTATPPRKVSAGKPNEEDADVFSDEQMAELRAALGKAEDEELTGEEIMAGFRQLAEQAKAKGKGKDGQDGKDGEPAPEKLAAAAAKLPPGILAVDQGEWEALKASAAKGERAHAQMQRDKRDAAIGEAVKAGKFAPARRHIYERLWDNDPQGTAELLASMQKGAVPLSDIGAAGGDMEDGLDREFEGLYPPGTFDRAGR